MRYYPTKAAVPLQQGQTLGFKGGKGGGYFARGKPLSDQAYVTSQIDDVLGPIIGDLRAQGKLTSSNLGGVYNALAQQQAQVAPAIEQTYQTATANTAAFGKGYSDALKAQLGDSAAQANVILAQNGSPQHVEGGQGAADVLFGLGGSIPGQALAREGAAFTAAAQQLPATARGVGAQQQAQALHEMNAAIAKIEAEKPGLIQKALGELQQSRMDQQELALKQALAQQEFGLDQARLGLEQQRIDVSSENVGLSKARLKLDWAGLRFKSAKARKEAQKAALEGPRPNATLSKVYGYVVDEDGRAILNEQGKKIPVAKGKDGAGITGPQKSTLLATATTVGEHALEGITDRIWANTPFSDVNPADFKQGTPEYDAAVRQANQAKKTYRARLAKNYGAAMAAVIQAIGPHLHVIGYTQAQIKAVAQRIVSSQITK